MNLVAVAAADVVPGDTLVHYGPRDVISVESARCPHDGRYLRTRLFFMPVPNGLLCYFEFDSFATVWIAG
ncbi:MAG: hypothetical protein ACJA07_001515 [Rhodococcus sp. (in: high G+C Gram-positive bacteria)]|jgi:hypothetical protein